METRAYWKRVHREACLETRLWRREHPDATMRGIAFAVVCIVGIWMVGSQQIALEDAIARTVATLVILLAIPWVYWTKIVGIPARWHAEQQSKIAEQAATIEALTRSPLSFVDSHDNATSFRASNNVLARAFVRNDGERTIVGCQATVMRVVRRFSEYQPLLREFPRRLAADPVDAVDAHPGCLLAFQFFEQRGEAIVLAPMSSGPELNLPNGEYHITVMVTGRDVPSPVTQVYSVDVKSPGFGSGRVDGAGDEPFALIRKDVSNVAR